MIQIHEESISVSFAEMIADGFRTDDAVVAAEKAMEAVSVEHPDWMTVEVPNVSVSEDEEKIWVDLRLIDRKDSDEFWSKTTVEAVLGKLECE